MSAWKAASEREISASSRVSDGPLVVVGVEVAVGVDGRDADAERLREQEGQRAQPVGEARAGG